MFWVLNACWLRMWLNCNYICSSIVFYYSHIGLNGFLSFSTQIHAINLSFLIINVNINILKYICRRKCLPTVMVSVLRFLHGKLRFHYCCSRFLKDEGLPGFR